MKTISRMFTPMAGRTCLLVFLCLSAGCWGFSFQARGQRSIGGPRERCCGVRRAACPEALNRVRARNPAATHRLPGQDDEFGVQSNVGSRRRRPRQPSRPSPLIQSRRRSLCEVESVAGRGQSIGRNGPIRWPARTQPAVPGPKLFPIRRKLDRPKAHCRKANRPSPTGRKAMRGPRGIPFAIPAPATTAGRPEPPPQPADAGARHPGARQAIGAGCRSASARAEVGTGHPDQARRAKHCTAAPR